jgi:hypothetical protein
MGICVGDVGRAVTDISPGGAVELDGSRYPARSIDDVTIPAGTEVELVRAEKTCFVVRRTGSAEPLPNRGEPIGPFGFDTLRAAVARAEKKEARDRRSELLKRMRTGAAVAAVFGALAGVASAWLGWRYDWAGVTESVSQGTLFAGSAAAGVVLGVVLYFFTGFFAVHCLPSEADAVFEPGFVAIAAGLVGAALGFWMKLAGGEPAVIALWTGGLALIFAALAAGLAWALDMVL